MKSAVTVHWDTGGSGQSSPMHQFVKPEVTARKAAVELAAEKVWRAGRRSEHWKGNVGGGSGPSDITNSGDGV